MKFKSALVTQASGSVGGATFAHNQGGLYVRGRGIPTNPNSDQQQAVRANMTTLSTAWVNTLTNAQRTAWKTYSTNVKLVGPLGDARSVPAISMYNRSNGPRLQASLARVDAAPTVFDLGTFTPPTFTNTAASQLVTVTTTGSDAWTTGTANALLVYLSRPQNQSIVYFKGPYRLAGKITGTATGGVTGGVVTAPFAVTAGQKVFYKTSVTFSDGRLTSNVSGSFSVA